MVGAALNLASKFTVKAITDLILFARYIGARMTHRYEYSNPSTYSPSTRGRNGPVSFSKALTIMRVLDGFEYCKIQKRIRE
jgi:hypothetical protein